MTKNIPVDKDDSAKVKEAGLNRNLLQLADLDKDIQEIRAELDQERDRHLRTLADFKNYRRRIEREVNKMADAAKREIILPLLDIVDDFEKSLQWTNDRDQPVMNGVAMIYHKLLALLENQGVRPFDSVGKLFTPDMHQAVAVTENENIKPGTILEDLRKGYLWNNELLRPAQVRVAG